MCSHIQIKPTKTSVLSLSVIIFSVFLVVKGTDDPCSTTNYLNDWRRSVAFEIDTVQICDNILEEGWYRIISGQGDKMPTECPEYGFKCNTAIPIWLLNETATNGEDVFPNEGDVVNRTAYASHYTGDCKSHAYNIKIKGCTGFLVYYLVPTTTCSSAYCFGTEQPCASGTSSDTGFTPDCGAYPKIPILPFVIPSQEEEDVTLDDNKNFTFSKVIFECHSNDTQPNYEYDVRWYINDLEITDARTNNLTKTEVDDGFGKMTEDDWTSMFRPNFIVNCSIQVKEDRYRLPSPEHHSEQFFAGIEVQQDTYTVNENLEIVIPVRLTIPISCNWDRDRNIFVQQAMQGNCVLNLLTGIPGYQKSPSTQCQNGISDSGLIFDYQYCGISFNYSHWDETKYLKLTGAADNLINRKDRLVLLRLYNEVRRVQPNKDSLFMWNGTVLSDIKVTIHDTDHLISGKGCSSLNDPHMYSFDGSQHWELQQNIGAGEYIMYLHNRLPLQINAYFRDCNGLGYALCNCGLAVRSGDSVFVANFCETTVRRDGISERKLNRYIIQRLCDDQRLIVTENGNTIEVILPTGTKVRFFHGQVYNFYGIHGIFIYPTALDRDLTNGLCGIYNGNASDDFVPREEDLPSDSVTFAKSWKIDENSSLAEYTLFDPSGYLREATYYAQEYCTCRVNDTKFPHESPLYNCNLTSAMETCRKTNTTRSVITASCANKSLRVKRSIGNHITKRLEDEGDDEPPAYQMVPVIEQNNAAVQWRNGWTEDSARDFCTLNIKSSPAYLPCSEFVPASNPDSIIEICILDIKLQGDTGWMDQTLQNFADSCLQQARRMENLTVTNSTSSNGETKSIFSIIAQSTCPGNCSERGICENGICNCTTGYYGPACSMDKSHLPSVVADAFEGNCNTQNRPCKKFIIPGNDFIDDTLTCRFSQFSMQQDGPKISFVTDDTFIHPGIYSSAFLMYCELPPSRRKKSVENTTALIGYNISVSNNGVDFTDELTTIIYDPLCYECNLTSITCVELDTCSSKTEEPSVESKLSTWVIVLVVLSSIVLVISIGFFCVRKNIRFGKQVPYVTDSNVALPNRYGRVQSIPPTKHEDIFLAAQSRYNTEL